jgi:hypothetical protein
VYKTFLTLIICTKTRKAPNGNEINESKKLPEKLTEQTAGEHIPPMNLICHHLYMAGFCIRRSRSMEALATESLSWMAYAAVGNENVDVGTNQKEK